MNIYIRFFHEQKGIETIETRLKKTSHRLFNNLVYDVGQERIKKKLLILPYRNHIKRSTISFMSRNNNSKRIARLRKPPPSPWWSNGYLTCPRAPAPLIIQ